jgi:hypothetical protein
MQTLPFYDIGALKDIHDIVSVEPVQPRDKVMMGMLATIGIEPGKPFNPPAKLKVAMERGVADAYYYMQNLATKLFASNLYWPDRHWSFVMVPDAQRGFQFVGKDAVEIDKRCVGDRSRIQLAELFGVRPNLLCDETWSLEESG